MPAAWRFPKSPAGTSILCLALIVVGVGAYSIHGGLTSVMWADLFQCILLMVGGITLFFAALGQIPGGWGGLIAASPDRMHLYQPPGHDMAPFLGMIVATFGAFTFYQVGNQAMIQRMLAARSTWDALMGLVLAQFINFLRPLVTCFLGLVVYHWIFVMHQGAPPLETSRIWRSPSPWASLRRPGACGASWWPG